MMYRPRLLTSWAIGALVLSGTFYAAISWLWSAAEESRAASLEREVVSVLSNDLAEGNFFKLGQSLSRLQQEGHLRAAEIRRLGGSGGDGVVFRTRGQANQADALFSDFGCGQQRMVVRYSGGVGLITALPSTMAGAKCIALFINADLPNDLKRFKNRLMGAFGVLLIIFFVLLAWLTMAAHKKILDMEISGKEILGKIASQVAHDIRSPLAALDSVLKDVAQLPEEKRIIMRSAVSRIRDIANDLIDRNRELKAGAGTAGAAGGAGAAEPASVELLSSHIDPLITEKRLQYRSKIGVEIEGRLDAASYGLFATIQPAEFKRVLSNLINNSVEAMGEKGAVVISLTADQGGALIRIKDNGKGIPADILAKLGQRGETHGKAGGSGLGLYHAKTSVERWGGSLAIESAPGKGAAVTLKLPQAQAPDWFVSMLELEAGGTAVILDDDTSIHQIWQGRFDSIQARARGIELLHFSTPDELRGFVRENPVRARAARFLTDYELIGHPETGLKLVEELGIGERSILVTSRFEEKNILAECRRLKVRMIPKGLAGFVPISICAPVARRQGECPAPDAGQGLPTAVLLDDDALAQMVWKAAAKAKGINLLGFRAVSDFWAAVGGLAKETPIYLDCELGEGATTGDAIAKDLHAKGFTNLYLATGHAPESLAPMPWIKEVVGKTPPWS